MMTIMGDSSCGGSEYHWISKTSMHLQNEPLCTVKFVTFRTSVADVGVAVRLDKVLAALRLISAVSYGESTVNDISCGRMPAAIIDSYHLKEK